MLFDCVIREDILHSLQNNQASLILFGSFIVSLRKTSKILSLAVKNIQVNLIFLAHLFVSLNKIFCTRCKIIKQA